MVETQIGGCCECLSVIITVPNGGSLSIPSAYPQSRNFSWAAYRNQYTERGNLFHRAYERIERELDDNEQAQKRSQRDQDGSEIRSVELERLTAEGMTLIERRNGMEYFRDQAAEHFARYTGSHWHPRSGSMVNHRALTSAVIDSRDFLAAKRRAETEVLLPRRTEDRLH